MDFSESTKVVYDRIQKLEPENVSKIIGYLLLQDHGEREMIRLAFSPDNLIHSLINKAKANLGLSNPSVSGPISLSQAIQTPLAEVPLKFTPYAPTSRLVSPLATLRPWEAVDFVPHVYSDSFLNLEDHLESVNSISSDFSSSYFYSEPALGIRTSRRSPSMPEFPVKVCHYFNKGFCKHGSNCRYFHGLPMTESFSQIFSSNSNDLLNEDNIVSLNKLEMEITELLKSRRGVPVSIASLPMLYYEKYGRTLQAEGYLTESQRHGKAGYSLTKLLARLKNSIRLIDRPHGQHSVILAEDVNKYLEYASDKSDQFGIIAGSRQIYLTFPAESNFTEQDVSTYFSKFGPVQDVRIPCQQKRMFGFVTFIFAETVKQILAKGNPHFICGARVLVKPYRDKSRLVERKFLEKFHLPLQYGQQFIDEDSELNQFPRHCDNSRILIRKQLIEEHEQALELERMRLSNFQFNPKNTPHPCFGYSMDELNFQEERSEFPSADRFNYLLDVFNNGSTSEEKIRSINTSYSEQDSSTQGLNLPDSPFASPIGSGISTTI